MGIDYNKRPSKADAQAAPAAPEAVGYTKAPPSATKEPLAMSPASSAPAPSTPVMLGKVTLTKSAPGVSLTKGTAAGGTLRVNLNWTARPGGGEPPPPPKGFLKKLAAAADTRGGNGAIDLDLACLYEYTDGSKGVVQALGNAFQDKHTFGAEPICWLDGDDRSGTNTGGENLFVNLKHAAAIKRVLIFAFIYQGIPNWAAADAVVTLFPAEGGQVEIRLDEADNKAPMCAIAMLSNDGTGIKVNREIRYIHGGQSLLDKEFGWGMQWARASK